MARRKPAGTITGTAPTGATAGDSRGGRARPILLALGTIVAAGAVAWLVSSVVVGRAVAGRLPALPSPAADLPLVAEAMASADAAARRWPTAASVGELAMTYHSNLRPAEAMQAYALAATLDPQAWQWPYYRGLLLEERGDQLRATGEFTAVARLAPDQRLARFHLAEIAFKAGRLEEARSGYLAARAAGATFGQPQVADLPPRGGIPLGAYASLGLARVELELGDRGKAREQLSAIVRAHPQFGSAHALLGQLLDQPRTGDDGRAYVPPADPWLDSVVAKSWHPEMLLKHAAIAARSGDAAWREWLVRRALEASPNGLDVLLEAASTERAAGRLTEALRFLQQAEGAAPDDHHTLVEQGRTLSDLGRLAEAEAVLRRATRVRDATAEYNLANVLDQMDRWDEAREHYERAIAINPFHARAMNNLGIGFSRRGQPQQAIAFYQRAIAVAPDVADTYTNLSAALGAMGRLQEALAATDAAIRLAPSAADAHSNRGIALAQLGRRAEARAAFESALRLDPGHRDARRNLAAIGRYY